jgi:CRISP-associated protein Cas1
MRMTSPLYVTDHRARVSTSKSSLRVRHGDGSTTRVPMESLEAVVLLGHAQITSQAMDACVKRGIPVTSLSPGGRVRFQVRGGVSGNVELRRAQVAATLDSDHKLALARSFVAGKLQNARRAVLRWARDADGPQRSMLERRERHITDRLLAVPASRDANHLRGLEGEAARQYFRALGAVLGRAGYTFIDRNRRPPRDAPNALLSFVYGLVTAEVSGALTAVGLDPQIGYLHEPRPGRPALALDVVEELRTGHADRFVVRSLMRREVTPNDFETRPGGAVHLTDGGRRQVLGLWREFCDEPIDHILFSARIERWMIPHAQATLLARHLRGDLPAYAPFVMSG